MKKVLIISPHFPPVNAADTHRVRHSLPYFKEMGWEAVVIAVDEKYIESYSIDPLLSLTIPRYIEVLKVKAFDINKTRKFGLGSLSMRSYFQVKHKGNELLKKRKFDLIYFSTTAFHVMALGPGWKRKFNVPFILDIQDPWRNDYYLDKPVKERPPKFFISYNIDKYLEAKTLPFADGIISVSEGYCDTYLKRYKNLKREIFCVIPFGFNTDDFSIAEQYLKKVEKVNFDRSKINVVYVGRGGFDMRFAVEIFFAAIAKGLKENKNVFDALKVWFIGTSYAKAGAGQKTIEPVAKELGLEKYTVEITDRIGYFETLFLLKKADILFVPGSVDTSYTASKIYPYIYSDKPLLAIFNKRSSVPEIINKTNGGQVVVFEGQPDETQMKDLVDNCYNKLLKLINTKEKKEALNAKAFEEYTAKSMTRKQVDFFEKVLNNKDSYK